MKTLMNLKLFAVSLLLWAGMTSCLKGSDPDFMVVPDVAYLEQTGSGDNARYTPVMRIVGNYPIAQATCTFEGRTYYFTDIIGNDYYMELDPYMSSSVDTVTTGVCAISAVSAETEARGASNQIRFSNVKQLGDFTVETLEYDKQKKVITMTCTPSEGAEDYVLMYQVDPSQIMVPYDEFKTTEKDGKLTAEISFEAADNTTYRIAVGATNGTVVLIEGNRSLTIE